MSTTVHFKTRSTIAGGVGTPVTGDTVNQTERDMISALGGVPGSTETYDWAPHRAAQPTCKTSILNGYSVARFDGGDSLTNSSYFDLGDTYTIYWVGAFANGSATSQAPWEISVGTGANTGCSLSDFGNTLIWRAISDFSVQNNAQIPAVRDGVFRVFTCSCYGVDVGIELFFNGTSQATATYTPASTRTITQLTLGALATGTFNFTGDSAELIVCSEAHNSAMRSVVNHYLGAKYAISIA